MRRLIMTSLLSLFLIAGSATAMADNHRGSNHDKGRKEQKFDKKRPGGNKNHNDRKPAQRPPMPPKVTHRPPMPPAPPAPPAYHPRHYNHAYHYPHYSVHDNLGYMVSQIVRGGRDVSVWQVNSGTYVVRFRKGNHIYTQYVYPYEGRYGQRSTISVNWSPLSLWTLIPSVHLNISL